MEFTNFSTLQQERNYQILFEADPKSLIGRVRDGGETFSGELDSIRSVWTPLRDSRLAELVYSVNGEIELISPRINSDEVDMITQDGSIDVYNNIVRRARKESNLGRISGVIGFGFGFGVGVGVSQASGESIYTLIGILAGGMMGGKVGNIFDARAKELLNFDIVKAFNNLNGRVFEADEYVRSCWNHKSNGRY